MRKDATILPVKDQINLIVVQGEQPYIVRTPDELWSAIVDDILIKYGSGIQITVERERKIQ